MLRRPLLTALLLLATTSAAPAPKEYDYTGTDGPPIRFHALLSADEQSAPTTSPGVGCALFVLDRPTLELTWTITYSQLTSTATAAHVHGPQTPGGNAGVLFDLAPDGMGNPLKGALVLNDGLLAYLLTGRVYVNLHTTQYPAGELRGQVMRLRPDEADLGC